MKKLLKILTSRAFYLVSGILLSIVVFSTYAAWNTVKSPGEPLTYTMWNEIVNKLNDLDGRVGALESGGGGSCSWTGWNSVGGLNCGGSIAACCAVAVTRTQSYCDHNVITQTRQVDVCLACNGNCLP